MTRYFRPSKRYKSFSDAPFTLRIATSWERCLMSNNEIPKQAKTNYYNSYTSEKEHKQKLFMIIFIKFSHIVLQQKNI